MAGKSGGSHVVGERQVLLLDGTRRREWRRATQQPGRVRSLCVGGSGWSGPGDAANYSALGKVLSEGESLGALLHSMAPEGAPPPTDEEVGALDAMMAANDRMALAAVALGMPEIVGL